jgi:hypothetical protein
MQDGMNEFVPRIESTPPDRAAARPVSVVAPVQVANSSGLSANADPDPGARQEKARQDNMASASDYAKVQSRVSAILAGLSSAADSTLQARGAAEAQIVALIPQPTVIVPMPPASRDVIERALEVARSMAQQATLTRAAQANVNSGTVQQLLA